MATADPLMSPATAPPGRPPPGADRLPDDARPLAGRIAIVTGASTGIGLAITRRLTADGARVVGGWLRPQDPDPLLAFPGVISMRADVTKPADIDALVAAALGAGGLDVLVNNAGIMDRFLPAAEVTDDMWRAVLDVNLTGPMMLARAAIPHMTKAGRGVIINIASVGGLAGGRAGAAYTASKHGLIGLTKNIAATYGRDGIRAVAVAPGGVDTGISLGGDPSPRGLATLQKTLATMPRMGRASEIADVVAFLASDGASLLNGSVIAADAGWTAH